MTKVFQILNKKKQDFFFLLGANQKLEFKPKIISNMVSWHKQEHSGKAAAQWQQNKNKLEIGKRLKPNVILLAKNVLTERKKKI